MTMKTLYLKIIIYYNAITFFQLRIHLANFIKTGLRKVVCVYVLSNTQRFLTTGSIRTLRANFSLFVHNLAICVAVGTIVANNQCFVKRLLRFTTCCTIYKPWRSASNLLIIVNKRMQNYIATILIVGSCFIFLHYSNSNLTLYVSAQTTWV